MRLFSCKVRLSNSLYNEVNKIGVTAAEIMILRHIHSPSNDDGSVAVDNATVADIVACGDVDRSDDAERARLQGLYGMALKKKGLSLPHMFGVGSPLPNTVDGIGGDNGLAPVVRRGRPPKKPDVLEVEPEATTAAVG